MTTPNEKKNETAIDYELEITRTKPDYTIFKPTLNNDTGNEHVLVFDAPDGSLMVVWTQSSYEGAGDHRIVLSRSKDNGKNWSQPVRIAGPSQKGQCNQTSWGFPLVSKSGRIYVLYNQYQGIADFHHQVTGTMDAIFTDDLGKSWSNPQTIPMKRSPYDHPNPKYPSNWIVWQKPERLSKGKYFTGFTRWVSPEVRTPPHYHNTWSQDSVTEFMRFENIDDDPEPRDIEITNSAWGEKALRVGHYTNPLLSVAQEPSIVKLPDDRLFCVMRTMTGYIWYSVSSDQGLNWCNPRPLLRKDFGKVILQPICCCPIYTLSDGRFILLHHDRLNETKPEDSQTNRRPAYIALGEFRPNAEQPIWFSNSKQLMDNDNVPLGPLNRVDLGVYSSFTNRNSEDVLWHPDRKFFVLGKKITPEFLKDLKVTQTKHT